MITIFSWLFEAKHRSSSRLMKTLIIALAESFSRFDCNCFKTQSFHCSTSYSILCNDHAGRDNLYFDSWRNKLFLFLLLSVFSRIKRKHFLRVFVNSKSTGNIWPWLVFPQHLPFSKTSIHTSTCFTCKDRAYGATRLCKTSDCFAVYTSAKACNMYLISWVF